MSAKRPGWLPQRIVNLMAIESRVHAAPDEIPGDLEAAIATAQDALSQASAVLALWAEMERRVSLFRKQDPGGDASLIRAEVLREAIDWARSALEVPHA